MASLKHGRGFSLVEILVAAGLLTLLLGLAAKSFVSQKSRAGPEGLVQVVAAELEAARAKALSSHIPVAFCLPSEGGSRPHSQGFYLMEGEVTPQVTDKRILASDFPNSFVAVVHWGSAELSRPANAGSFPPSAVATWLGSRVGKDFALVFMPDGSVMSNDLPLMDGEYRLLVASGLASEPGGPTTPTVMPALPQAFLLKEAFAAHTISISGLGDIRVTPGVKNPSGVKVATQPINIASAPAKLNPPAPPSASTPTIESVSVYPEPFLEPKATVQQERNLSLTVEAQDSDGQQLFCTWEATPLAPATEKGSFSLPDAHPMLWNADKNRWVSQTTWAPPSVANPGDRYTLTCRVTDGDANSVNITADVLNPVTVIPPGQLFFWRVDPAYNRYKVATINTDGTGLRDLNISKENNTSASVTPDGTKIAWVSKDNNPSGALSVMNSDGTGAYEVPGVPQGVDTTAWSPEGDKIFYNTSGTSVFYSCNPDGSDIQTVPVIGNGAGSQASRAINFSPDGRYIAYRSHFSEFDIVVGEYVRNGTPVIKDATNVTNNTAGGFEDENVLAFVPGSPDNRVIWGSIYAAPSALPIYKTWTAKLQDNGTGFVPRFELVDVQLMGTDPVRDIVFSPDGKRLIYTAGISPRGMYIGEWNDNGASPPTITNARKLTVGTTGEYPCAWTR